MQHQAVPASKTGRRNYVWSNEETQTLVNVLRGNLRYQLTLIPGRVTKEQEKGLKMKKSTMLQAIFPLIFPEEREIEWSRIKSKILTMHRQYIAERERLGQTGSGLLFEQLSEGSSAHLKRQQLAAKHPWFEDWHRMALDRGDTTPSEVFQGGSYDAGDVSDSGSCNNTAGNQKGEYDTDLEINGTDDELESTCNGRGLPSLDKLAASSQADPLGKRLFRPVTPNGSCRQSYVEDDDAAEEDQFVAGRQQTESQSSSRSRTPLRPAAKKARTSPGKATEKRDAMIATLVQSKEERNEARMKKEEEKTKREELKTQRALAQVQLEKEKLDREERWKREEVDRQERQRQEDLAREEQRRKEDKQQSIDLALQIVELLQSRSRLQHQGSSTQSM